MRLTPSQAASIECAGNRLRLSSSNWITDIGPLFSGSCQSLRVTGSGSVPEGRRPRRVGENPAHVVAGTLRRLSIRLFCHILSTSDYLLRVHGRTKQLSPSAAKIRRPLL